jgi:hypothetical protein
VSQNLEEKMNHQKMMMMMTMMMIVTVMMSVRICCLTIKIYPKMNHNKKRKVPQEFRKVNQNIRKVTTESVVMKTKVVGCHLISQMRRLSFPSSQNYQNSS